LLNSIAEE